jgi:isoamylase
LNDLVSYNDKHNEANGENNKDGIDQNLSWNCGFEGDTRDAGIEALRKRQIKNFLLTLLMSRGVPMMLGGDEFRRTQGGNNNAYCQDNETSWMDWSCLGRHQDIFRFAKGVIAFRRAHPIFSKGEFYTGNEIRWYGPQGGAPDWADPKEKHFACSIREDEQYTLFIMFNAGTDAVDFHLPSPPHGMQWHLAVDTFGASPSDLFDEGEEPLLKCPRNLPPATPLQRRPFGSESGTPSEK